VQLNSFLLSLTTLTHRSLNRGHRLFGEVPHEAPEYCLSDKLFELGLVHGGAVDPAVAAFPRLLYSFEDAYLPHGFEEVDYAGAADGVGLELGVDSVPYDFGAEALRARPDHPERNLLVVLEDGP